MQREPHLLGTAPNSTNHITLSICCHDDAERAPALNSPSKNSERSSGCPMNS